MTASRFPESWWRLGDVDKGCIPLLIPPLQGGLPGGGGGGGGGDNPRGESGGGGGIPTLVFLDQSGPTEKAESDFCEWFSEGSLRAWDQIRAGRTWLPVGWCAGLGRAGS